MDEQITNELELFKDFLKKRGASKNTIDSYLSTVRLYFSRLSKIDLISLHQFRIYLIDQFRANTVNTRIFGMNQYLLFLKTQELLPEELQNFKLSSIKHQQKPFLDNVITKRDYERLKKGLKNDGNMFWYFVVRFLAATGARISELIQIKVEHIRIGCMDLYSKGGKLRRIYFPEKLCMEMLSWLEIQGKDSGFIFVNRRGQQITPRGISWQLKVLAKRYRIPVETIYPHSFRHRFAKNFLSKFNDISLLADLMGHESIETTRIYLTQSSKEQSHLIDKIVTW